MIDKNIRLFDTLTTDFVMLKPLPSSPSFACFFSSRLVWRGYYIGLFSYTSKLFLFTGNFHGITDFGFQITKNKKLF
jgi:hypothetical protein